MCSEDLVHVVHVHELVGVEEVEGVVHQLHDVESQTEQHDERDAFAPPGMPRT